MTQHKAQDDEQALAGQTAPVDDVAPEEPAPSGQPTPPPPDRWWSRFGPFRRQGKATADGSNGKAGRRRLVAWPRQLSVPLLMLLTFGLGLWIGPPSAAPETGHDHAASGDEATVWTCSMHPQIQLPEPGDCPICGMDLIPLQADDSDAAKPNQVQLSEHAKVLARVRTVPSIPMMVESSASSIIAARPSVTSISSSARASLQSSWVAR